ncbi:MAG: hypothetical protein KDN05_16730 [Verrucomicrobiae bacterium]|nr:hypothetical protein [Verrucomicrobiae bacterium]
MKTRKHRTFSVVLGLLAILATQVSAIQLKDLLGTWKGKRTELQSGVGGYSNATLIGKRTSDGGVIVTEIGTSKWIGAYKIKHTFQKNGTYRSKQTLYGLILATSSGKWRIKGSAISISGVGRSSSGSSKFSGLLRKPTKKTLVYSGKSGSISVTIRGKKQ